jgi:AraC-like DNA-binding protein
MTGDLVVLPLPILVFVLSAVSTLLIARADLGNVTARRLFVAFFAVIAVGTLLVGLRFGYGFERLIALQRILPLFAGPLLYLGFAVYATDPARVRRLIAIHLGVAVLLAVVPSQLFRNWDGLDALILLSYLFYAIALLILRARGANHLTQARIGMTYGLRLWMLWGAVFLLSFLIVDSAIAISFAMQRTKEAMTIISYASLILLCCLLAIIIAVSRGAFAARPVAASGTSPTEDADAIEARARKLLIDTELFLDTDLTVDRLAKRLHIPVRNLSSAINQSQGMNVSQYVNGFRLRHAAHLLTTTRASVREIMEQSGFLTRSNFYREFHRAYDMSPAAFRQTDVKD